MGDQSDNIKPRDIALLQARVANPTASSRELSKLLSEEYDINLSHNHVNTLLREMQSEDLFQKTVLPRRTLFNHYIFRIAFHYPNFKNNWKDCREMLVEDPHVLMFFNADSKYRWQLITQFRTNEQMDNWVTAFFEEHGEMIDEFDTTSVHNLHKFNTDAEIFDDMLIETEEGRGYLSNRTDLDTDDGSTAGEVNQEETNSLSRGE